MVVPVASPPARVKKPRLSLLGKLAGSMLSTRATSPVGVPPLAVTPAATLTLAPWVIFSAETPPLSVSEAVVAVSPALAQLATSWAASTEPSPLASS